MAAAYVTRSLNAQTAAAPSLADACAAWCTVAIVDLALWLGGAGLVLRLLARLTARHRRTVHADAIARTVVAAVEHALLFYPRRIRCLQSAATAAALLRMKRVPCDLVIGVRRVPFLAHAWVEVDGRIVINEEAGRMHLYQKMTRC